MPQEKDAQSEDFADLTTLPSEEEGADDNVEQVQKVAGEEEPPEDLAEEDIQPDVYDLIVKGEFGEDVHVKASLDDLKSSYMQQAQLTRRFQEAAKKNDEMDARIHEANTKHRTEYINTLETMRKALMDTIEPEFASVNWQTLARENPEEYMRLQARGSQFNALITKISQEQDARAREQAQHDYAARTEMIRKSVSELTATIPGWNDALYSDILGTVSAKYGFSTKEVGEIIDPRLVRAMYDLTRFHKAMDKKSLAGKVPQGQVKTIPASGSSGPVHRQANVAKAVERARQSGSVQDAAMALTLRQKARR